MAFISEAGGTRDSRATPSRQALSDDATDGAFASFLAALASSPPPYRPPQFMPREVFAERYQVQRELGRGGMGTVYLARDLELHRNVALKLAAGRKADVELERLQQEARTMAGLSHSNIVTVFEAGAYEGHVYISMEFVPGGTLRDWMDADERPWRVVLGLFLDVGRALAAAHAAEIVHRDFKPENVLLALDGTPKIADFGLAAPAPRTAGDDGDLLTTSVVGTPAYMAPEQALGQRATAKSDQFSYCVSLYEALASHRPFGGRTLPELLEAIESGTLEENPRGRVPSALLRVLRRGLAFEASARYDDMAALVRELERIAGARARRVRAASLGVGLAVAAGLGFASASAPQPCLEQDVRQTVAAVWDESTADAVQRRTSTEFAAAAADYVDDLVEQRMQVCRAREVEQSISEAAFTLRQRCLDRAQSRLVGMLADVEASPGPRAASDVERWLPDLGACHDDEALALLGNRLSSTSAFSNSAQDRASQRFNALVIQGELQLSRGEPVSEQTQRGLRELAEDSNRPDAEVTLLMFQALAEPDPRRRRDLRLRAMELMGSDPEPELIAELALELTSDSIALRELDAARQHLRYAESLRAWMPKRPGATRSASTLLVLRGVILKGQGELDEAERALWEAIERAEPGSSEATQARDALAGLLVAQQQPARASEVYAELLELDALPARRRFILSANAADAAVAASREGDALRLCDAAELAADGLELPPAYRATVELTRAAAQTHGEAWAVAEATLDRAQAILGDADSMSADVADARGALALARDRYDDAERHFMRALEIRGESPSSATASSRASIAGLVRVRLVTDRAAEALPLAERLLEGAAEAPHATLAEAELLVARSRGLPGGRELAASARQRCRGSSHRTCADVEAGVARFLDG